mmetsp:Transcript_34258/g.71315  ORF Transcript_34258/g.71315 Transcript_34258/m.71315 type:complete len:324 (-) Transcript_34258:39-1010(-)
MAMVEKRQRVLCIVILSILIVVGQIGLVTIHIVDWHTRSFRNILIECFHGIADPNLLCGTTISSIEKGLNIIAVGGTGHTGARVVFVQSYLIFSLAASIGFHKGTRSADSALVIVLILFIVVLFIIGLVISIIVVLVVVVVITVVVAVFKTNTCRCHSAGKRLETCFGHEGIDKCFVVASRVILTLEYPVEGVSSIGSKARGHSHVPKLILVFSGIGSTSIFVRAPYATVMCHIESLKGGQVFQHVGGFRKVQFVTQIGIGHSKLQGIKVGSVTACSNRSCASDGCHSQPCQECGGRYTRCSSMQMSFSTAAPAIHDDDWFRF